ncbi:hypothetical protein Tco_0140441 [Tanacetum coccineum]
MHNNIMAQVQGYRPPMLATGRYAQCDHGFLRYIDTNQMEMPVTELKKSGNHSKGNNQALVASAQTLQDPYYQSSKSHKSYATQSKASPPTRSHATTRYKGKEIAKNPSHHHLSPLLRRQTDPEQAQRIRTFKKICSHVQSTIKKLYKPTNNNLRTSSNSKNMNVDTTPRYRNDTQAGQFGNQRTVLKSLFGARETVGVQ